MLASGNADPLNPMVGNVLDIGDGDGYLFELPYS